MERRRERGRERAEIKGLGSRNEDLNIYGDTKEEGNNVT